MNRLLLSSRYLVNLAVIAALVGAAAILIYGVIVLIHLMIELIQSRTFTSEAVKSITLSFIQLIDLLFLGVALYIIALGLYHLFIDTSLRLPRWLKIENFDELKIILLSVVIVILAINFTGVVVDWDGSAAILNLGLAIAAVIAGLGLIFYVRLIASHHTESGKTTGTQQSLEEHP
ncbi:YqhA family protein [Leptolyngbya ohadii]|uniref:YqhA family protein n=1 Tax=Leptolyngbya ohadii TaxID=1962290 RepID=UPI000B59A96A|nr:YqhA family protein [Leptolyngbya ohadii]